MNCHHTKHMTIALNRNLKTINRKKQRKEWISIPILYDINNSQNEIFHDHSRFSHVRPVCH